MTVSKITISRLKSGGRYYLPAPYRARPGGRQLWHRGGQAGGHPGCVVSRAKEILHGLEGEEGEPKKHRPQTDAGFENDDGQMSLLPAEKNEVVQRLKEIDVNTLTPIEAMQALYELAKLASAY